MRKVIVKAIIKKAAGAPAKLVGTKKVKNPKAGSPYGTYPGAGGSVTLKRGNYDSGYDPHLTMKRFGKNYELPGYKKPARAKNGYEAGIPNYSIAKEDAHVGAMGYLRSAEQSAKRVGIRDAKRGAKGVAPKVAAKKPVKKQK